MTTVARKKLVREMKEMESFETALVGAAPTEHDFLVWEAYIMG
jgi:ubiquitin-protein ligase